MDRRKVINVADKILMLKRLYSVYFQLGTDKPHHAYLLKMVELLTSEILILFRFFGRVEVAPLALGCKDELTTMFQNLFELFLVQDREVHKNESSSMANTRKLLEFVLQKKEGATSMFGDLLQRWVVGSRLEDEVKKVVRFLQPFFRSQIRGVFTHLFSQYDYKAV
mmetsp:Transcript_13543/g.21109  ORF Transcript_13543/g.21109 Transcript_13543/m.21109 type:complete len:166 (-) Transcript_13543:11000-11497(-)